MSTQPVGHFTDFLMEWQSPAMIPVVLELLNEKLDYLEDRHKTNSALSTLNIRAYQSLYQHWKNDKTLNQTQKDWIQEMGGSLNTLKHRIFNSPSNHNSDLNQTEKSPFELKI